MNQLTNIASLVVLSTALAAAGCAADATETDATTDEAMTQLDEIMASQADAVNAADFADSESEPFPAPDSDAAAPTGGEDVGENAEASRFWWGGWGFRPWWGGWGFRPWWGGWGGWGFRPWWGGWGGCWW